MSWFSSCLEKVFYRHVSIDSLPCLTAVVYVRNLTKRWKVNITYNGNFLVTHIMWDPRRRMESLVCMKPPVIQGSTGAWFTFEYWKRVVWCSKGGDQLCTRLLRIIFIISPGRIQTPQGRAIKIVSVNAWGIMRPEISQSLALSSVQPKQRAK